MLQRLKVPLLTVPLLTLPILAAMSLGRLPDAAFAQGASAQVQDLPIIVTYELRKQRLAARSAARDPKRFWIRQVFNRIENKSPQLSKPLKGPVVVRLSFAVAHDGRLLSKSISTSSGDAEADKAAVTMIERAAPFPPMPDAMSDAEMTFALPVRFR